MIRVYRLPERLTDGFCFQGGKPITFTNVDWFDAPPLDMGISREDIEAEVRGKRYFDPRTAFLVLDDRPGETFVIAAEEIATPTFFNLPLRTMVERVKRYRKAFGCSLKEAIAACEAGWMPGDGRDEP